MRFFQILVVASIAICAIGYVMVDDLYINPEINDKKMKVDEERIPVEMLDGVVTRIERTHNGTHTGIAFRVNGSDHDIFLSYPSVVTVEKNQEVRIKKACHKYTVLKTQEGSLLDIGDEWTTCSYIIGDTFFSAGKYGSVDSYSRVFPSSEIKNISNFDDDITTKCLREGRIIIDCVR